MKTTASSLFCSALLLLGALLPPRAAAQGVSFDLQVDLLQTDKVGESLPLTSLWLLVADTSRNGFADVPVTSLGSGSGDVTSFHLTLEGGGDDLILWRGDLAGGGFDVPGLLIGSPDQLAFQRGTYGDLLWDTGDPLAIYWFPTLTPSSTATNAGDSYGYLSAQSPEFGNPWVTPGDYISYSLYFVTSNDTGLTGLAGTAAPEMLVASYTVVPEPATYATWGGLAGLLAAAWRRGTRKPTDS